MARRLNILAVHGVGYHAVDGDWTARWTDAIRRSVGRISADARVHVEFVHYDDVFDAEAITAAGTLEAIATLGASGLRHGVGDALAGVFGRRAPRSRGTSTAAIPDRLRWTAGMVVQWAGSDAIRERTRRRLAAAVASAQPDVVMAHSLGSLIAYDTFVHADNAGLLAGRTFVSFGSQIGNSFVRGCFGGRIVALDCEHWYHLHNEEDDVFTAPVRVASERFEQVECTFDIEGFADHDALGYLQHANLGNVVWRDLLSTRRFRRESRRVRADVDARVAPGGRSPKQRAQDRRALLIGIDDYPDPGDRLAGCVNDVFLMSEVLQESGFEASQIRSVLNDRATAQGIRERIHWLLDGAQPGDRRVLYFSGHGTQITDYGLDETVDRRDECLVPYDFDWTRERAIVDDWFHDLYTQLPYDVRFTAIFDCCHSGGMTRAGSGRPKGLSPPDDVRHREIRWDPAAQLWVPRTLEPPNRSLARGRRGKDYLGASGTNRRLGRGTDVLTLTNRRYDAARERYGHRGPYMPVIVQACQEDELAYEYRHGVTSHGAFTYALAQALRSPEARRGLSMDALHVDVATRVRTMGFEQRPELVGPWAITSETTQWCQLRG